MMSSDLRKEFDAATKTAQGISHRMYFELEFEDAFVYSKQYWVPRSLADKALAEIERLEKDLFLEQGLNLNAEKKIKELQSQLAEKEKEIQRLKNYGNYPDQ